MAESNEPIRPPQTPGERGASKLIDPTPQRKRYVIELLYKFLTDQITHAQLTGIPQKDLYMISEIGYVKLKHGRVDEAKRIFDCLVRLDHKNPFYHSCLGSVYQKMGKFVDAVYEYSEALKLKKDDMGSLVNRGEVYLMHKNFKKAAEDFRTTILLDPLGKNMYANRARSLVIAIKRNLQMQKALPKGKKGKPPLSLGGKPAGSAPMALPSGRGTK